MLRTIKPKNARSKRAMEARMPKEVEDAKVAIFVKGTHTGEKVNAAMKELMLLKRPDAISFSKKNVIHPFESAASLEFWSDKNDASLFVVGQTSKKRPDNLVWVRMFGGKVLEMIETGIDNFVSMDQFKTPKSTPGHRPLMHFASELFDTHPRFVQLKSLLLDFFNGQIVESVCLAGLGHVISVTLSPTPASLTSTTTTTSTDDTSSLPKVHIRTYTTKFLASGFRVPRLQLEPMGPSLDLTLRRHTPPEPELWKQAMKRPKMKKQDVEKGLGKKRKNMQLDEMGDLRGRVHVGTQDLSKLQTRKMRGLKKSLDEGDSNTEEDEEEDKPRKRRKT